MDCFAVNAAHKGEYYTEWFTAAAKFNSHETIEFKKDDKSPLILKQAYDELLVKAREETMPSIKMKLFMMKQEKAQKKKPSTNGEQPTPQKVERNWETGGQSLIAGGSGSTTTIPQPQSKKADPAPPAAETGSPSADDLLYAALDFFETKMMEATAKKTLPTGQQMYGCLVCADVAARQCSRELDRACGQALLAFCLQREHERWNKTAFALYWLAAKAGHPYANKHGLMIFAQKDVEWLQGFFDNPEHQKILDEDFEDYRLRDIGILGKDASFVRHGTGHSLGGNAGGSKGPTVGRGTTPAQAASKGPIGGGYMLSSGAAATQSFAASVLATKREIQLSKPVLDPNCPALEYRLGGGPTTQSSPIWRGPAAAVAAAATGPGAGAGSGVKTGSGDSPLADPGMSRSRGWKTGGTGGQQQSHSGGLGAGLGASAAKAEASAVKEKEEKEAAGAQVRNARAGFLDRLAAQTKKAKA